MHERILGARKVTIDDSENNEDILFDALNDGIS
jgi:hypothetical protein